MKIGSRKQEDNNLGMNNAEEFSNDDINQYLNTNVDNVEPQGMDNTQNNMEPIPQDGNNDKSTYDTNFDAGVEADEDTDPKRYIQQLTGKLSTTLSSFNKESDDESLNKYVAKMIVKQAVKAMDEKGKKELIKAINTADDSDSKEEEKEPQEEEINEVCFSKKELNEFLIKK